MTLPDALDALAADLELLPDARERIAVLVRWGQRATELPPGDCTDALRVSGCISKVWLEGISDNGFCRFRIAADSPMVRGLAGVTARLADGQASDLLATADLDWPARFGLDGSITPTRLNGLASVARAVREFARSA